MLDRSIICSDAFIELDPLSQCLYLHANMNADDDGFVNNLVAITRMVGCSKNNIAELIEQRFILDMGKGIYVIKHWHINNTVRKDRYIPTKYQDLYKLLYITPDKKYKLLAEKETEDDDSIYIEPESDSAEEAEVCQNQSEDEDRDLNEGNCNDSDDRSTVATQYVATQNRYTQYVATQSSIEKSSIDKCCVNSHTIPDITTTSVNSESKQKEINNVCEDVNYFQTMNSPGLKILAENIMNTMHEAGLPCRDGNFLAFYMGDFTQGMNVLRNLHLHTDEILGAVHNYADVVELADETWWDSRQNFYNFCQSKTILKFIPSNFDIKTYQKKKYTPQRNRGSYIEQQGLDVFNPERQVVPF